MMLPIVLEQSIKVKVYSDMEIYRHAAFTQQNYSTPSKEAGYLVNRLN